MARFWAQCAATGKAAEEGPRGRRQTETLDLAQDKIDWQMQLRPGFLSSHRRRRLTTSALFLCAQTHHVAVWRNGSASDSRSEGWEFESLCGHLEKSSSMWKCVVLSTDGAAGLAASSYCDRQPLPLGCQGLVSLWQATSCPRPCDRKRRRRKGVAAGAGKMVRSWAQCAATRKAAEDGPRGRRQTETALGLCAGQDGLANASSCWLSQLALQTSS